MYRQGAEKGDGVAMINLGQMLEDDGDSQAALGWYRKARDAGEDRASDRVERLELVLRRPESDWSGGGSGRPKYCSDCGSRLVGAGRFCPNCGAFIGGTEETFLTDGKLCIECYTAERREYERSLDTGDDDDYEDYSL